MDAKQVFRVAILGSPQLERWLLVPAFAATRKRACIYLATDPGFRRPDLYVIDPDNDLALARWPKPGPGLRERAEDCRPIRPAKFRWE